MAAWRAGEFLKVSESLASQRILLGYGDRNGVGFMKRVADVRRFYKNTIATEFSGGDQNVLLALTKFRFHPRRNAMLRAMRAAFDDRECFGSNAAWLGRHG